MLLAQEPQSPKPVNPSPKPQDCSLGWWYEGDLRCRYTTNTKVALHYLGHKAQALFTGCMYRAKGGPSRNMGPSCRPQKCDSFYCWDRQRPQEGRQAKWAKNKVLGTYLHGRSEHGPETACAGSRPKNLKLCVNSKTCRVSAKIVKAKQDCKQPEHASSS